MIHISSEQKMHLKKFIEGYSTFIVTGHKEPDADCISSSLALAHLLKAYGKKVLLLSAGPFKRIETKKYEAQFYTTLEDARKGEQNTDENAGLFVVDCSTLERLGSIQESLKNYPLFVIDHHKTSIAVNKNCIIESKSPATAYLMQLIFSVCHIPLTIDIAELLFLGLATDTGFFRFLGEDTADVLRGAAELVDLGVSPRYIYAKINSGKSLESRKFLANLIERTERYYNGKLIVTYETLADEAKYGSNVRDSDMLYQMLLSVEGVEAVLFMRQETPTQCTAGLRSHEAIDVSSIASQFGGGGHKNASGLGMESTIEDLMPKLIEAFKAAF